MKLIYFDGSELSCETIEVIGNDFYCDDYRIVPISDIERIEED